MCATESVCVCVCRQVLDAHLMMMKSLKITSCSAKWLSIVEPVKTFLIKMKNVIF